MITSFKKLKNIINEKGIYKLSDNLGTSTVDTEITLADSINNYDYLIITSGAIWNNSYRHTIAMPFSALYTLNKKSKPEWRIGSDKIITETASGIIALDIVSDKEVKIIASSGTEDIRNILGVKL